jgi:hypothetical protein
MHFNKNLAGKTMYLRGKKVDLTGYQEHSAKGRFVQVLIDGDNLNMANWNNLDSETGPDAYKHDRFLTLWKRNAYSKFAKNAKATRKFIDYLNSKPTVFSIGSQTMAEESGVGRTVVIQRLADLESFGLLVKTCNKPGSANVYVKTCNNNGKS